MREAASVFAEVIAIGLSTLCVQWGAVVLLAQDVSSAAPQRLEKLAKRPPARVHARASSFIADTCDELSGATGGLAANDFVSNGSESWLLFFCGKGTCSRRLCDGNFHC
jgi:hypothetical protein